MVFLPSFGGVAVVVDMVGVVLLFRFLPGSDHGRAPATPMIPGTYTKHTPENVPGSK